MNPLDRINQLNDEIALLRSQLSDVRKQLEADSATIAKLSADKRELVSALRKYRDGVVLCTEIVDSKTAWEIFQDSEEILSRHA